jgi:hypothetical protein
VELKLNETYELLVFADNVKLLGDNIDTMNRSTETLIDAIRDVDLVVNTEEIKYVLYRHQIAE